MEVSIRGGEWRVTSERSYRGISPSRKRSHGGSGRPRVLTIVKRRSGARGIWTSSFCGVFGAGEAREVESAKRAFNARVRARVRVCTIK